MHYVIIYIILHLLHFSATQNVNLSITNNILTCFYSETNMTQIDIFMYNKSIKLNEDTQHVHPDMTYLARYDERNSTFYINHLYAQLGELNINFNYFKIKLNKIEHGDRYQCVVIINFRKVLVSNLVNLKKNMNNYTDIYNVHTNLIHPTQTNKEDFLNYNLSFPIEVDSSGEYELINENSIEIKGSARYEPNITLSNTFNDIHTNLIHPTQTNEEDFLKYNLSFPIEGDSSDEYELINKNSQSHTFNNVHINLTQTNEEDFLNYNLSFPIKINNSNDKNNSYNTFITKINNETINSKTKNDVLLITLSYNTFKNYNDNNTTISNTLFSTKTPSISNKITLDFNVLIIMFFIFILK